MQFPLKKSAKPTWDSESFVSLNLRFETEIPVGNSHPGAFAFERRNHVHEGVDLYALEGDEVFAMEPGIVVSLGPFTGPAAGFPWWADTDFIMIEGASGVLCYGEIAVNKSLSVGDVVEEGALLGTIATVLVKDKGRPRNMLHLEYYEKGIKASCGVWAKGTPRPEGLRDPTALLLVAANV